MPVTQSVSADVRISGTASTVSPIDIDTRVRGSSISNVAVVKMFMSDPTDLERDQRITVHINDNVVFSGRIKFATQGFNEHEVTVEAYDMFYNMHDHEVTLQTEQAYPLTRIARNLLTEFSQKTFGEDRLVESSADPNEVPEGSIYVAPPSDFIGGEVTTHKQYGSGNSGESLVDVLEDLTDGLLGVMWTDRRGVFRIEPVPSRDNLQASNIIDVSGGDDINTQDTVKEYLVGSPSSSVGGGIDLGHLWNDFKEDGMFFYGQVLYGAQEEVPEGEFTLLDENVTTYKELNNRSGAEYLKDVLHKSNHGSITLAGTPDVHPWDQVTIPDIDNISLVSGVHSAATVRNILNSQDGWQTEISLVPEISEVTTSASSESGVISDLTNLWLDATSTLQPMTLG